MSSTPSSTTQSCPSAGLVAGVAAGVASTEERAYWEAHTQDCNACVQRLQDITTASDAASETPDLASLLARGKELSRSLPSPPEALWEQPHAFLFEEPVAPSRPLPLESPKQPFWEAFGEWVRGYVWQGAWGLSAVCVLTIVVLWPEPPVLRSGQPSTSRHVSVDKRQTLRPKGVRRLQKPLFLPDARSLRPMSDEIRFRYFLRRGGVTRKGRDGMLVLARDELRFGYDASSERRLYVLLWMSNPAGEASLLYPADATRVQQLAPGRGMFLPDGAELDGETRDERIYVCVSEQPLRFARAQAALQKGLAKRPLQRLHTLSLPCVYQTSWLLRKQRPAPKRPLLPERRMP